jgi:hypothetical protein
MQKSQISSYALDLEGLMRYAGWMVAAAAIIGCNGVGADVYKWVDDKGVVNYTNTAPAANRNVTKLDPSNPRVSFYKSVPASPEELTRLEEALRFRQVLELAEETNQAAGVRVIDPYPGWYQQCMFELWGDCNDPRALNTRYANPLWGYPLGAAIGAPRVSARNIAPFKPQSFQPGKLPGRSM